MIIAATHIHNAERWIGYAIAALVNHVDKVLVGLTKQSTDHTRLIIDELQDVTDKIIIYDNDSTDKTEGGFGAVKTHMIKRCGKLGAGWILNFDHDHIYYPMGNKLRELIKELDEVGMCAAKFRQYFIYSGLRTLPLNHEINPKVNNPGYSMFASFFKYSDKIFVKGEVHETVKEVGAWTYHPEIDFAHVGPLGLSDWETVEKELFYARLNHKMENKEDEINWLKKCIEIKFFPTCMLDFTARRRLEFPLGLPDISEVKKEGLPPVLDTYVNGHHAIDIEWLKKFIKEGK